MDESDSDLEARMGFDKDIANIKYNFLTTLDKATAKMVDECKREKCFDDIFKD